MVSDKKAPGAIHKFWEQGLGVGAAKWQSSPPSAKVKTSPEKSAEAKRAKELAALASRFSEIADRAAELDRIGRSKTLRTQTPPTKPTERPAPEKLDPAAAHNAAARAPTPKASPDKRASPNHALESLYASAASYEHELGSLVAENVALKDENAHLREMIEELLWRERNRGLYERRLAEEEEELARHHERLQMEEEARRRRAGYRPRYSEPSPVTRQHEPMHSAPFDVGDIDPYADTPPFEDDGRGFDDLKARHGYPRSRPTHSAAQPFYDSPARGHPPAASQHYAPGPFAPPDDAPWPMW